MSKVLTTPDLARDDMVTTPPPPAAAKNVSMAPCPPPIHRPRFRTWPKAPSNAPVRNLQHTHSLPNVFNGSLTLPPRRLAPRSISLVNLDSGDAGDDDDDDDMIFFTPFHGFSHVVLQPPPLIANNGSATAAGGCRPPNPKCNLVLLSAFDGDGDDDDLPYLDDDDDDMAESDDESDDMSIDDNMNGNGIAEAIKLKKRPASAPPFLYTWG